MTLQNRFLKEARMAADQGICDEIGDECCTVIPLHTGVNGNLTRILDKMRQMRDEHVRNSSWNTQLKGFWDWLGKLGWLKYLKMIGAVLGGILPVVLVVICCIIPLLRTLISSMIKGITGQFPLVQMVQVVEQAHNVELQEELISEI